MIIAVSSVSCRNKLKTSILEQIACAKRDSFSACELHACFRGQSLSEEDIETALKDEMTFSVHATFKDNNISSLDPGIVCKLRIAEGVLYVGAF